MQARTTQGQISSYGSSQIYSVQTVRERRYIRLNEPRWPFWFWGLMPLLGLLLTWYLAMTAYRNSVEESVRQNIRTGLDKAGYSWVALNVSGQEVTLSGLAPSTADAENARIIADTQTCPTWFGQRLCRRWVKTDFATAAAGTEVAAAQVATPLVMPDYLHTLKDGILTLTGEMPSIAIKDAVFAAANAAIAPPKITQVLDQMTVREKAHVEGYRMVAERGIAAIRRCKSGTSTLSSGLYSLRCTIASADEASIRATATAPLTAPLQLGAVELLVEEAIAGCEQAIKDLLAQSKIKFAVSRADINAGSNVLLDQIAEKVKACPGTLRIEGHTDPDGDLASNMILSQARADAVKNALAQRGIDTARLTTEGFGPNQPIADNATAAGKAQNRRIEFKVVTF